VPPPTSSTDITSAVPRTTEPTGTGDGNRTLSTPTLTPIDVPVTSNILGIRSLTSDRVGSVGDRARQALGVTST
jgi:hypothetical protein